MNTIFQDENTEAVLLVDAANAFNSVNRNVFLHNIKIICPSISTFVHNCYSIVSRLFVLGGMELKSEEGTTQGDPIAMAVYAIAIIPMIFMIMEVVNETKTVAYADDVTAAGELFSLRRWWNQLCLLGPKFGYFPEATKSWLIVKNDVFKKANMVFSDSSVNITITGKRHLGAVLGSCVFKDEYMAHKVKNWCK